MDPLHGRVGQLSVWVGDAFPPCDGLGDGVGQLDDGEAKGRKVLLVSQRVPAHGGDRRIGDFP
ncbi:hypothetical protein D3C85_1941580 [compost metagenome]